MQCPFCNEEIKDGAKKCRFCGEFIDDWKSEKKKKSIWCLWRCIIIFVVCPLIALVFWLFFGDSYKSNTKQTTTVSTTKKAPATLQDHYNKHKNYIRNVCKEWLKLISNNQAHNFEWPTYAGEYQWKFIIKWTDNWIIFRCEFIPFDNERWMNLEDVKMEY